MNLFSERLLAWHREHGRHDLPWQRSRDPYRVWVAEIMLQQTQVGSVVPYFERFMTEFPTVLALADAEVDSVLHAWAGLGYYARARNLHAAAAIIRDEHDGAFPDTFDAVAALPGVGRSTAGAILATAFDARHPILDGNCKRVYARHAGIEGWSGATVVARALWAQADAVTPATDARDYTQAIMDLGATVCTRARPQCHCCPVAGDCIALRDNRSSELPTPRPRRVRPLRTASLLIVRNRVGEILLERRPQKGIWGGLWCLPWVEGTGPRAARALPTVRHAFTHFELDITPWTLDADAFDADDGSARRVWADPARRATLGLPAPVRRLLDALESAS
ncbi:MAG: A/G-specific adenine glycosylase [Gammaproteobacteria bacterium]